MGAIVRVHVSRLAQRSSASQSAMFEARSREVQRKHQEDRIAIARGWNVDPFSTGVLFPGWREHADAPLMWRWRDTYDPLVVYRPKTWLLREGWTRHGLISFTEVPRSA